MKGIRERLNERPAMTVGAITVLTIAALGFTVYQVIASHRRIPLKSPDSYFSVDDGKTFFVASSDNIPPFDYKGKTAVHAYVFESNGKRFVGFLERYTPEARAKILAGQRTAEVERFGREIKRPGQNNWVKTGDLAAEAKVTMSIKSPDGSEVAEAVEP
jgi:hypothetical protein